MCNNNIYKKWYVIKNHVGNKKNTYFDLIIHCKYSEGSQSSLVLLHSTVEFLDQKSAMNCNALQIFKLHNSSLLFRKNVVYLSTIMLSIVTLNFA